MVLDAGLDKLQAFLDRGSPPVLFTPGSANRAASQFFAAALNAARRLSCRALFLTQYPEQLPGALGSDAWHEPYVPFSHVLRRCAAKRLAPPNKIQRIQAFSLNHR